MMNYGHSQNTENYYLPDKKMLGVTPKKLGSGYTLQSFLWQHHKKGFPLLSLTQQNNHKTITTIKKQQIINNPLLCRTIQQK